MRTKNCSLKFNLFHVDNTIENQVRVLYVICNDDDGRFQSPNLINNDYKSALKRISLNMRLLQTFIDEMIYKQFGVRKTFKFVGNTVSDDNICELYYSKLNLKTALSMKSKELFVYLANEISSRRDVFVSNCKYVAILSFTRYEPSVSTNDIFENTKGFCALGMN